jgi:hypothetical protein
MPRVRDPLDDLELHEVPPSPRTPWLWAVIALVAGAFLIWMLLSRINQPEAGGVREGRGLLNGPAERVGDVDRRG